MAEPESETGNTSVADTEQSRAIVDKLVFAALNEQRRARRWRVGFMLFFIVYLSVVTIALFTGGDSDDGPGQAADGEKHTALVRLEGLIASGDEGDAENVISGLRAAFKHADTAGIVLEVNSPGGSPVQSAYMYDEIMRLKQAHADVPIYAVVSDAAVSGGYFVAAAADRIYVNKSSLVGSIGVRLDGFGFVDLMDQLGVERRLLTSGEHKGLFDPFLPEKSDDVQHLQKMLDQVHGHFISAVKEGRGDRLADNDAIFSGLFWSGEEAVNLGLADAYGSRHSVARELGAEEIVDFTPRLNLLDRIAQTIGVSAGSRIGKIFSGGPMLY